MVIVLLSDVKGLARKVQQTPYRSEEYFPNEREMRDITGRAGGFEVGSQSVREDMLVDACVISMVSRVL